MGSPYIILPRSYRQPPVPPVAGGTAISGQITNASGGAAVAAGVVDLMDASASVIIDTRIPDGTGRYSFASPTSGNRVVRYTPPLRWSQGSVPNGQVSITAGGSPQTCDFTVTAANGWEDFQSITTNAQLQNAVSPIPAGDVWSNFTNVDIGSVANPSAITLATWAPDGSKSMRYTWPGRPASLCGGDELLISTQPRFNPPPVQSEWWVRMLVYDFSPFLNGRTGCVRSYKNLLFGFENDGLNRIGRFGTYFFTGSAGVPSIALAMDFNDKLNNVQQNACDNYSAGNNPVDIGNPTWGGTPAAFVIRMAGIGTSSASLTCWLNNVLVDKIPRPAQTPTAFMPGVTVGGSGWANNLEPGSNINNGPDLSQTRDFREVGVYSSQPSLLQAIAG